MKKMLSTREVAKLINVNEKMVYTLISEKGLPATKVTGKWLFPEHLVEQWVDNATINAPSQPAGAFREDALLVAGSNDILFERTLALFMERQPGHTALFGNMGSMGGLHALRRGAVHMATSHLAQEDGEEYNFAFAAEELDELPVVVNFSRREQGILLAPGKPKSIASVADMAAKGCTVVNRPLGTGTRLLFDRQLKAAGVEPSEVRGYAHEAARHMDVGLEILSGRADAGLGIRAVAGLLGLDFVPLALERFDLLIPRDRFFDKPVQLFLNLLRDPAFLDLAESLSGYDTSLSGQTVFPGE